MPRRKRWLPQSSLGLLALAASFACTDPEKAGPTATLTIPITATEQAPPTPAPSSTAVGEDAIAAVVSGDLETVMAQIAFSSIGCSADTWPFPACEPGEAPGSTSPRLPFVGCEPSFLNEQALRVVVGQIVTGRAPELYTVLESVEMPGALFPLGPRVAVFATRPPAGISQRTGILAVIDQSGRITSLRTGCRATPEQLAALVPVPAPEPTPTASATP